MIKSLKKFFCMFCDTVVMVVAVCWMNRKGGKK